MGFSSEVSASPFALAVGGHDFEFCVFVVGRRHALHSEWPFVVVFISVGQYHRL